MGVGGASGSQALAQARATPSPVQAVPVPHEVHARIPPLKAPKSALVEFDVSPFPYEGLVPRTSRPFFDAMDEDGRRGHSRARALWEDATYSDAGRRCSCRATAAGRDRGLSARTATG
jgi:hypothetical protein